MTLKQTNSKRGMWQQHNRRSTGLCLSHGRVKIT
jgi:hypothetical protein